MGFVIVLLIIVLTVISLIFFIKYQVFKKYLLDNFKTNSCIAYGKKRKGKDILFQWIINKRHDFYYSNISYGGKYKLVKLIDVSVEPNTYLEFIYGKITKTKRKFYEEKDIYISDIQNYAPSVYDSVLNKEFKSLPIFHSLSGHLYSNRFHCNAQVLGKIWKPIREQADFYVHVRGTKKLFGFIFITSLTTYEKYESAERCLFPLKRAHFNKYSKADFNRYYAENGMIKNGYIISFKWNLKYDSRAFEKILMKGKRKYYKRK